MPKNIVAKSLNTLYTSVAFVRNTFARKRGSTLQATPVPVMVVFVA